MSSTSLKMMPSDAKYSAIEHGGLELADRQEREETAPEIVPGSNPPLERKNSLNQPEPVVVNEHDGASAPQYEEGTRPSYINPDTTKEKMIPAAGAVEAQQNKPRRYCGMSKKVFIIVIIVGILVILGVVLGAVLGTVLGGDDDDDSSPQPSSTPSAAGSNSTMNDNSTSPLVANQKTGLATTLSAHDSSTLLMYYQDPSGRIIENILSNGNWSLADQSQINNSIVTDQAEPGSPLAAISYLSKGAFHRQLFFFNPNGNLMSTNTSSFNSNNGAVNWSQPLQISSWTASASGNSIAACAGNNTSGGLNGVRVYFPISDNGIQETGYDFNNVTQGWQDWQYWYPSEADARAGVACTTYAKGGNFYMNVYLRNSTLGKLQQAYFNYNDPGWVYQGPTISNPIAYNSDLAACGDQVDTDYIFFQGPDGTVSRALISPAGTEFSEVQAQGNALNGSKLTSAYYDDTPLYMFQNSTNTSTVWLNANSRNGQSVMDIAVP